MALLVASTDARDINVYLFTVLSGEQPSLRFRLVL